MADKTITELTATTSAATADEIPIWVAGSAVTRKITKANFLQGAFTGGGTVATGGYTLTVPATGTAALINVAQTYSANSTFPRIQVDDSSHYIDVDSSGALLLQSSRVSIADNGTVDLGYGIALLFVSDTSQANVGLFYLRGGVNAVSEIFDPSGVYTTTKDSASSFNVYYESSKYYIQNKRGGTRTVSLWMMAS